MAVLTIRNLPDEVRDRHRLRAARAYLALAIDLGVEAMTADRAWEAIDLPVKVVQIRD